MTKRISTSYVATLNPITDADQIAQIRSDIHFMNEVLKSQNLSTRYRVCLKGRKPINKVNGRGFTYGGDVVGGLKNAGMVDVYIYNR